MRNRRFCLISSCHRRPPEIIKRPVTFPSYGPNFLLVDHLSKASKSQHLFLHQTQKSIHGHLMRSAERDQALKRTLFSSLRACVFYEHSWIKSNIQMFDKQLSLRDERFTILRLLSAFKLVICQSVVSARNDPSRVPRRAHRSSGCSVRADTGCNLRTWSSRGINLITFGSGNREACQYRFYKL